MLTHGSLFSGIGGFDLAANWAGFKNIFQVEIDGFCQQVLKKNFPEIKKFIDIKEFRGEEFYGAIDVISGGFPCQPFSFAGKKRGKQDDRYLWNEMLRVISEIKPSWVIAENVYGLVTMQGGMVLEQVLIDLEGEGYEVQSFIIPACSKNAPHRRDRLWIVAHSESNRNRRRQNSPGVQRDECNSSRREGMGDQFDDSSKVMAESAWERDWLETASEFCRNDDGISHRVDRIKALGNAIVPQVAYEMFLQIKILSERQQSFITSEDRIEEEILSK